MTRTLPDKIDAKLKALLQLASGYPPLSPQRSELTIKRLDKLAKEYRRRKPTGKVTYEIEVQNREMLAALTYAITVIKMQRRLTEKLQKLAEEASPYETRSNS